MRVRLSGQRRKRLQIMAERLSDGQMSVDDCARLSRALSPVFDLEDPIPGEFDLEVSSPGIDRPLMRIEDFERFIGHEAKLETAAMIDGRRRFKGVIAGVEGDVIVLATDQGESAAAFRGAVGRAPRADRQADRRRFETRAQARLEGRRHASRTT